MGRVVDYLNTLVKTIYCVFSTFSLEHADCSNYLGRVTKPRIIEAVREGAGERAAQLIDHLKKSDMATEAERLLAETGWLPEPLRMVDRDADIAMDAGVNTEADDLPEFLAGDGEDEDATEDEEQPMVAAE